MDDINLTGIETTKREVSIDVKVSHLMSALKTNSIDLSELYYLIQNQLCLDAKVHVDAYIKRDMWCISVTEGYGHYEMTETNIIRKATPEEINVWLKLEEFIKD